MPRYLLLTVYAAIAILAAVLIYKYILPILIPFIIALIVSVIMEPVIRILQRKLKMPRGFAVMTSMIVVFGGITVLISVIILQLISELIQLSISLPTVAVELSLYYQELVEKITAFYITLPPGLISSIEQNINNLVASLQGLISKAVNSIFLYMSFVPGTLAVLVVSLLATYFLARDRYQIADLVVRIIPAPWGDKAIAVLQEISRAFVGYLRAQVILVSITTVLSVAGLYLIGAEYALTIGLLIGLFDLIPVLGPATIYIPWIIWSFATGAVGFGVKMTILYAVVLLVRQFSEARIVAANLGLHPLATLAAMYAGLKTIGFFGLILGPILLIAIQAVIKAGVLTPKAK